MGLVGAWRMVSVMLFLCGVVTRSEDDGGLSEKPESAVLTWGVNVENQLGLGNMDPNFYKENVMSPTIASNLQGEGIVKVDAGLHHALALSWDGTVFAWGNNDHYQLGTDNLESNEDNPVIRVTSLSMFRVVDIAAGGNHSLAVTDSGHVYAWGINSNGQLGLGFGLQKSTPMKVSFPEIIQVDRMVAGAQYSMVLSTDGDAYAWGKNHEWQLGINDLDNEDRFHPSPVRFPDDRRVTSIAAGTTHSLATDDEGAVYIWGSIPAMGLSPEGIIDQARVPQKIETFPQSDGELFFNEVAAGSVHSLALTTVGRLYAWGTSRHGEVGLGVGQTNYHTPRHIHKIPGGLVTRIVARGHQSLALSDKGLMYVWGWNNEGQLGLGWGTDENHDMHFPTIVTDVGGDRYKKIQDATFSTDGLFAVAVAGDPCANVVCNVAAEDLSSGCTLSAYCLNGKCSYNTLRDGTDCDDGNACTAYASCQKGSCVRHSMHEDGYSCSVVHECTMDSVCKNGECVGNQQKNVPDGIVCDDGNACTLRDSCLDGVCVGVGLEECDYSENMCWAPQTCDVLTGECPPPIAVADGTRCDDDNFCTVDDVCFNGECGGDPYVCSDKGDCVVDSICNPAGGCSHVPAVDGTWCSDGAGTCDGGECLRYDNGTFVIAAITSPFPASSTSTSTSGSTVVTTEDESASIEFALSLERSFVMGVQHGLAQVASEGESSISGRISHLVHEAKRGSIGSEMSKLMNDEQVAVVGGPGFSFSEEQLGAFKTPYLSFEALPEPFVDTETHPMVSTVVPTDDGEVFARLAYDMDWNDCIFVVDGSSVGRDIAQSFGDACVRLDVAYTVIGLGEDTIDETMDVLMQMEFEALFLFVDFRLMFPVVRQAKLVGLTEKVSLVGGLTFIESVTDSSTNKMQEWASDITVFGVVPNDGNGFTTSDFYNQYLSKYDKAPSLTAGFAYDAGLLACRAAVQAVVEQKPPSRPEVMIGMLNQETAVDGATGSVHLSANRRVGVNRALVSNVQQLDPTFGLVGDTRVVGEFDEGRRVWFKEGEDNGDDGSGNEGVGLVTKSHEDITVEAMQSGETWTLLDDLNIVPTVVACISALMFFSVLAYVKNSSHEKRKIEASPLSISLATHLATSAACKPAIINATGDWLAGKNSLRIVGDRMSTPVVLSLLVFASFLAQSLVSITVFANLTESSKLSSICITSIVTYVVVFLVGIWGRFVLIRLEGAHKQGNTQSQPPTVGLRDGEEVPTNHKLFAAALAVGSVVFAITSSVIGVHIPEALNGAWLIIYLASIVVIFILDGFRIVALVVAFKTEESDSDSEKNEVGLLSRLSARLSISKSHNSESSDATGAGARPASTSSNRNSNPHADALLGGIQNFLKRKNSSQSTGSNSKMGQKQGLVTDSGAGSSGGGGLSRSNSKVGAAIDKINQQGDQSGFWAGMGHRSMSVTNMVKRDGVSLPRETQNALNTDFSGRGSQS